MSKEPCKTSSSTATKILLVAALSIIVTCGLGWATLVHDVATADEVSTKIAKESPWLPHKIQVLNAVRKVELLDDQLGAIRTEQAVQGTKLDTIIKRLP